MTPEQRAQFIANVPDAEARREAERQFMAQENAWKALETACDAAGIDVDDEVIADHGDANIIALNKAYDDAVGAWEANTDHAGVEMDDADTPTRCALSGFLIHYDDAVLKDENTGEIILKSALGLPLDIHTGEFIGLPVTASSHEAASSTEAVA